MYFLTEEERKRLLKGLIPKSRQNEVNEDLRGWNWNRPPLEPLYDVKLALYEVASRYCPTGRDLFLRRVHKVKPPPNRAMTLGSVFHDTLVSIMVRAKRLIYEKGVAGYQEIVQTLREPDPAPLERHRASLGDEGFEEVMRRCRIIWEFEAARIIARIQEYLAKQPYIGEDSLVSLAIPVVVEQKLDGSFLGLSANLSADAFTFSEPMVLDLKFGDRRPFHRLTTAGYALVMEALHEYPINVGCLIYAEFREDRLVISKDFHLIDDEVRQWFIEERDEKMRMIAEEIDPGRADDCHPACPYHPTCWPSDGRQPGPRSRRSGN
ncbi:MAG: type I-A CRISPR-associated protein Cas4/Csa1 [Bacillota bacterium]|nr:type I-A CRISPR-associated protein Cas4/Csa1 [Bacillota bacterium]